MDISDRLYISTVATHAPQLAAEHGLGLEIAEYCTAANMDDHFAMTDALVRKKIVGIERLVFHAPFNELCPAAIDPLVVELTQQRYHQACALAKKYGSRHLVVHSGYLALLYDKNWFIEHSILFWRHFLQDLSFQMTILLENVFEDEPELLLAIIRGVDDPRLRLCLDVGHANTALSQSTPEQWIEYAAPYLEHVHLHNNDGVHDLHWELSEGTIDIVTVLNLLLDYCPRATFSLETLDGRTSIQWLQEQKFLSNREDSR